MASPLTPSTQPQVIYPDSDGQPMADNTKQFRWITIIQYNLDWLLAKDPLVFVAGDLLWYPVEGNNKLRQAPDVMVVFGVPKGDRGSYQQWQEKNIAPQVVFEIRSPGNRPGELDRKLAFYDRYGVEEYYLYDPDKNDLSGWLRSQSRLDVIDDLNNWVSPHLKIRFALSPTELQLYHPDGSSFASYTEIQQQLAQTAEQLAQTAEQLAQTEQRAVQAEQRAAELERRLREAGIDPDK